MINQGWSTLQALFGSFSFFTTALSGLSTAFGIPAFVPAIFILIIVQAILFMGKLMGLLEWSWWIVMLPFEIVFSLTIIILVVIEMMIMIDSIVLRDDGNE